MFPRVLLVAFTGSAPTAVRALSMECERVASSFEGVTRIDLGDRNVSPRRAALDRRAPRLSSVLPARDLPDLEDRYDLVVFHAMLASDLVHAAPLDAILSRADRSALWIHELWAKDIHAKHAGELAWFRKFDRMYVGFDGTAGPLATAIDRPVTPFLHALDVPSWIPPDPEPVRKIDLSWCGARIPETHDALLKLAKKHDLLYLYDTMRPSHLYGLDLHRRAFIDNSQRCKLMFVNPAKAAVPEHRGDQAGEIGYRYVEAAASGGVMVGGEPTSPTWNRLFNWPGACTHLPIGATDVEEPIMSLLNDPPRMQSISRQARAQALREMDIAYRWRDIMRDFNLESPPALDERVERLNKTADALAPRPNRATAAEPAPTQNQS